MSTRMIEQAKAASTVLAQLVERGYAVEVKPYPGPRVTVSVVSSDTGAVRRRTIPPQYFDAGTLDDCARQIDVDRFPSLHVQRRSRR